MIHKINKTLSILMLLTILLPYLAINENRLSIMSGLPGFFFLFDPVILVTYVLSIIGLVKIRSKRISEKKRTRYILVLYSIICILLSILQSYIDWNPNYDSFFGTLYIKISIGPCLGIIFSLMITVITWISHIKSKSIIREKSIVWFIIVSSISSVIYFIILIQLYYATPQTELLFLLGLISIPVLIVWFNSNSNQNIKKILRNLLLTVTIFIFINYVSCHFSNNILVDYFDKGYTNLVSFNKYTKEKGNNYSITKALIKKGIYPIYTQKGFDDTWVEAINNYDPLSKTQKAIDYSKYTEVVYLVNDETYICYNWNTLEITDMIDKDVLLNQVIQEKNLSGLKDTININFQSIRYYNDDHSYCSLYIIPSDGSIEIMSR